MKARAPLGVPDRPSVRDPGYVPAGACAESAAGDGGEPAVPAEA